MTAPRPNGPSKFLVNIRGAARTRVHLQWVALVVAALTVTSLGGAGGVAGASTPAGVTPPAATHPAAEPGTLDTPYPRVVGRPNDPPIGVSLETLSGEPNGAIRIDGQPVRDTTDRNGDFVAVIDRSTRAVVESGTVPRDSGMGQLAEIAKHWSGTDGYLMVVSGPRGVGAPDTANALTTVASLMGGRAFTADERTALLQGKQFSIVGIPGGGPGGAWQTVSQGSSGPQGDIRGWLQVNTATNLYNLVTPENPTFATVSGTSPAGQNTIMFDHKPYTVALPTGALNGFQILAVNALTLNVELQAAVPTNGPGDVAAQQAELAFLLRNAATFFNSSGVPPLVIVQSIGHPHGVSPAWARGGGATGAADDWIERLGGTRLAFNSLNGISDDYTLVGGLTVGHSAAEASAVLGKAGPLVGGLSRSRDLSFKPVSSGPPGGVNTELIDLSYQAPQAFPAFNTAGEAAAEAFIGTSLKLCPSVQTTCAIRPLYYQHYQTDWHQAATDLNALTYPGDGRGFSQAEFTKVQAQLRKEFSALNRVRTYFRALQVPFSEASQQGGVDLEALSNEIYQAAGGGGTKTSTSYVLGLIGKIAAVGGFAGPPVSAIAAGVSASFGLAAYLTQDTGEPQLATDVRVRADGLGKELRQRMNDASHSMTGMALLFVSDYGKLMAANDKLDTIPWTLPPDSGPTLVAMNLSAKRWLAESLVPVVYPRMWRGTPPPEGPANANGLSCAFKPDRYPARQIHPWSNQPANAQMRAVEGFRADGSSWSPNYFFSKLEFQDASPTTSLANLLFNPANPRTGTLGINQLDFISPRVFGPLDNINDGERCHFRPQATMSSTTVGAAAPHA
jgi:hypothetical protein